MVLMISCCNPMVAFLTHALALLFLVALCSGANITGSFIFGDSLVDAGNNNYIPTFSKANYPPNGIDFLPFRQPTGRFTNGRTIADIIGQELGLNQFSPPYMAPTTRGVAVLHGVNYASGAGGILNASGQIFGERFNLEAQIDNYANTRQELLSSIGTNKTSDLLKNSIFSITIGSNDFINNYLTLPLPPRQPTSLSSEIFIDTMITKYEKELTRLYNMDARKIVVSNVGPIGCIPYERDRSPLMEGADQCVELPNQLAISFNEKLKNLTTFLSSNSPGACFVLADIYSIVLDIILNYKIYGFDVADSACCHVAGRYGGLVPCTPTSSICPDRSKYVFWDPYHPSEAANLLIASRLLDGNSSDVFPINLRKLGVLQS